MPLETPLAPAEARAAELDRRFARHAAIDVVAHALSDPVVGPTALVSSFGAEAVVLLHMVSLIDRSAPVIFVDTEMLFPETLDYQRALAERLRLTGLRILAPERGEVFFEDPDGRLHARDPDACCDLRKTRPLGRALDGFGAWITGRKRFHGGRRVALPVFEAEDGRLKINPLARWRPEDVAAYIDNNRLPRHPLVARGFTSLGCAPCTTRTAPGEEPRAGRWRGRAKTECGIHLPGVAT